VLANRSQNQFKVPYVKIREFVVRRTFSIKMSFPTLILASSSPRRKELLALSGNQFQIKPADINENVLQDEEPQAYVSRLAREKAAAIGDRADAIVLAADTTVVLDGAILAKPIDEADARMMLQAQRGRTHVVYTAISGKRTSDGAQFEDICATSVPMRDYSDAEIEAYIATGDPLDKAGAYAIQHRGFHPVAEMTGCHANVIGLPLCHLQRNMKKWDIDFKADLSLACQEYLDYDCPVTEKILAWEQ
jgi:septum formation protein